MIGTTLKLLEYIVKNISKLIKLTSLGFKVDNILTTKINIVIIVFIKNSLSFIK